MPSTVFQQSDWLYIIINLDIVVVDNRHLTLIHAYVYLIRIASKSYLFPGMSKSWIQLLFDRAAALWRPYSAGILFKWWLQWQ